MPKIMGNFLTFMMSTPSIALIREYSPDPSEYDVLLSDVTHAKLQTSIAEELGIAYLSKASDPKEVVRCHGA